MYINILPLYFERFPELIVPALRKKGTNDMFGKFVHQNMIRNNHCTHNKMISVI